MTLNASQCLEHLYNKQYHKDDYHCAHLVVDVLKIIRGVDLTQLLLPLLSGHSFKTEWRKHLKRLDKPEHGCLVIMKGRGKRTHAGVYIRGRVFHLKDYAGVECVDIDVAQLGFTTTRYYQWLD